MTFETRRQYAMSDHFQPGRRVDRGLALFFGLGHSSVVELPRHSALLGATHGASGSGASAAPGLVRRFRVDLRLL